ncbi:type II toxin-antitoxin system VapC family toxin [Sphingomonas gilva]|uniref:Ribonuclease VapC n=1 Tax=Sphingomonas gilva TaxID=2305907 RepID=A0A396RPD8_9SPHN|nr:type II toxin-antitoxin system VapC family toxin [Sphingomonas gilva]RHW17112.1 type II toxin-antitoxin system VapC family toxin [Sphingomonas gilva]
MADARFLIDSNIAIYVLDDAACAPALRIAEFEPGEIITSAIAYAEVMHGIPLAQTKAAQALFDVVEVREFDTVAALAYARLPFRRARFDRLIAAHALSLGVTLVTNNTADFADIPDLRVENWTLPLT